MSFIVDEIRRKIKVMPYTPKYVTLHKYYKEYNDRIEALGVKPMFDSKTPSTRFYLT